jgi:hypothetical protein
VSARGEPLEAAARDLLEAVFAAELGDVRLHRGRVARAVAGALGATAVTFGRRVLLAAGADGGGGRPSAEGVALLAHEVAHVIQYRREGWAGMLARYLGAYLVARLRGRTHAEAYRGLRHEREATAWGGVVRDLLREPAVARAIEEGGRLPAPVRERAAAFAAGGPIPAPWKARARGGP